MTGKIPVLVLAISGTLLAQDQVVSDPQKQVPPPATSADDASAHEDSRDPILYSEDTERVGPLTSKLVRNTLLDQKDIWTSPWHIRHDDILPVAVLGASTAVLLVKDRWIATQLPNTVDQVSISQNVSNVGAVTTIIPVTAGLYIGGAIFHNPKARETGVLGGEAALDGLIVVSALKLALGRSRPLEHNGDGGFFTGGDSFPSGHSIETWALASVIAHEYNKNIVYPIITYSLASLVSFSRLSGQQHFSSDILVGSAMGWYIGRSVFKTHLDHSIHRRPVSKLSKLKPQAIVPEFDPVTGTRGLTLAWSLDR